MSGAGYGGVALDGFLFVCACELERIELPGVSTHVLGVGKTAVAMRLPALLRSAPFVRAVLLYGIAGAYPERHRTTPPPVRRGQLAIVGSDRFGDEGVDTPEGFRSIEDVLAPHYRTASGAKWPAAGAGAFPANPRMAQDAAARLGVPIVRGATVSTCSGTDASSRRLHERTHADLETMEGAAVAFVCRQLELPLLHLRAVSNWTGDRDRGDWNVGAAIDALRHGLQRLGADS